MKYRFAIIGIVLLLIAVFAFLFFHPSTRNKYQPTAAENDRIQKYIATHETSSEVDFTIDMLDKSFSPSSLEVAKGDKVVIHLKGIEGIHTFRLDDFNVRSQPFGASQEGMLTFTANKSGTYQFYSDRNDDKKNGMIGTLTVDK